MTTTIQGAQAPTLDLSVPVLVKQQFEAMDAPIPSAVFDQLDADLKERAARLSQLKREADDAEAAYKTARETMETEFAARHADVIAAKKRTADALLEVDANTRVLLEARARALGESGKVIGGLYTVETHAAPEVTNPKELIRWIITNAPVLATELLTVNTTAVKTFVTRFSETDEDDETGEPIRRMFSPFDTMPIHTGMRYTTRIEWSAIKKAYPVIVSAPTAELTASGDVEILS